STAAIAAKEIILVFFVTIEPPGATGHDLPHAFSPSEPCRGNKKIAGRKKTSCRFEFEPELLPQLDRSKPGAGSDDPHRAIKAVRAAVWGKMDVAQMMAHCGAALEMASGIFVAKRTLLGRIVGPRVRHALTDDSPFPRNSPTAKKLKISSGDFTQEH